MFSIVVFAVILLAALAFVFWPVLSRRTRVRAKLELERERLAREKQQTLSLIRDLEFDWNTGKIDVADYQVSRAEAEERAIAILKRLDELEGRRVMTASEIELEIARLREKLKREAVELGA